MAAIVARPTDPDSWWEGINYDWVGRTLIEPTLGNVDLRGSVLGPDILGRLLVANYWTCNTDIEKWWDDNVDNNEQPLVDEVTDDVNWVYIGAVDRFIVLARRDDGWWQGAVTWAGDPVDIQYQPMTNH